MSWRLAELAELAGAELVGDAERRIERVTTLDRAGPADLSFVTNRRYYRAARTSRAGALLVEPAFEPRGSDLLVAPNPYYALARLLTALAPSQPPPPGVHPTAVVAADAEVDASASVGPYAVIGAGSRIAGGAAVGAHAVVGRGCTIGRGALLHPHVVLYDRTEVGAGSILHAGTVLGSDGFGFATHEGEHHKIPHQGRVTLGPEVEIGANSTIDRAIFDDTVVGGGTKIDNLVQIGHNAAIGRSCLLVAQSGISGSVRLGDHVTVAGQSGVAGHLDLGDRVKVLSKSAVFRSVDSDQAVAGIPAGPAARWRRQQALAARLEELWARLRRLEQRLAPESER